MAPSRSQNHTLAPDILGHQHRYARCRDIDINHHFQEIHQWIPEGEEQEFKERMQKCVDEGNAWRTANTFLYYEKENERIAYGVALFGQEHTLELIALFIAIFWKEDRETYHLKFKLHPGKMLSEYSSMITKVSLERNRSEGTHPLSVNINELRHKFHDILLEQIPK